MSMVETDASRPWWTYNNIVESPHKTDLCGNCGHSRDMHGVDHKCRVYEKHIKAGGYEGDTIDPQTLRKTGEVHLPHNNVTYVRESCNCTGATEWYECTLPPHFEWDGLSRTQRDPEEKTDEYGNYQWWIPKTK